MTVCRWQELWEGSYSEVGTRGEEHESSLLPQIPHVKTPSPTWAHLSLNFGNRRSFRGLQLGPHHGSGILSSSRCLQPEAQKSWGAIQGHFIVSLPTGLCF